MFKALITIVVIIVSGIIIGTTASGFVNKDNDKRVLSTQSQATEAPAIMPGVPVHVSIPAIDVDTEIESVANDKNGRMDVPKDDMNTSWYNPGFRPGQDGKAVLAGHFDKKDGSPAIFWDLEKLKQGDEIIVTDDKGQEWKFAVTDSSKFPDKDFPIADVFGNADEPMLNLITCHGEWSSGNGYSDRYVVSSTLITE